MGLIRSGQTALTPEDDRELEPYLWNITSEIVKTAIENGQNLIVEGCYIPFTWEDSFSPSYRKHIKFYCLVMSHTYLTTHRNDIVRYADTIERRQDPSIDFDNLLRDNKRALAACQKYDLPYCLIESEYTIDSWTIQPLSLDETQEATELFYETVHAVNIRDYTESQISAWTPETEQARQAIANKLTSQRTVGIKECGILIGFGSLTHSFDIDMLYVHKHRQGQGIGMRLIEELEDIAVQNGKHIIKADVSLTALPFFERCGYTPILKQTVVRQGITLENFQMEKKINSNTIGSNIALSCSQSSIGLTKKEWHNMDNLTLHSISDNSSWIHEAAKWFSDKWGIPAESYAASMKESTLATNNVIPQWFIVRSSNCSSSPIIAGCGIIDNDFHDRLDLTPNLCALYVEESYRGNGIARSLLNYARAKTGEYGFDYLYLVTDLVGFYEKAGWEYLFDVNDTNGGTIRMYRASTKTSSKNKQL